MHERALVSMKWAVSHTAPMRRTCSSRRQRASPADNLLDEQSQGDERGFRSGRRAGLNFRNAQTRWESRGVPHESLFAFEEDRGERRQGSDLCHHRDRACSERGLRPPKAFTSTMLTSFFACHTAALRASAMGSVG